MFKQKIKSLAKFIIGLIKRFKPTKRNFIILGSSIVIVLGGSYLLLHHFRGDFMQVDSIGVKGKYYVLSTEKKDIKLSKNGELRIDSFYKRVDDENYREVDYTVFKTDLKENSIKVRTNLAGELEYLISGEDREIANSLTVNLKVDGTDVNVGRTGVNPVQEDFYINPKYCEITDGPTGGCITVKVSSEPFTIKFPDEYRDSIITLLPEIQNKLEECYGINSIDKLQQN